MATLYTMEKHTSDDIDNRFTYHKPFSDQPRRYEELRARARELAYEMCLACPKSRELSLALTKLEESIFWANASIARNETEIKEE